MKRLGLLFVICTLLLSGCGTTGTIAGSGVQNETIGSKEVYIMAGKVEANAEISVVSKLAAKVTKVAVDVGDQVKKGDPLVYLDMQDIKNQVKQAEAGLKLAQAGLTRTKKGARPEQIAQAKAGLDGAKLTYDGAKAYYDQIDALIAAGKATPDDKGTAYGKLIAAETQYKVAQEQYNMLVRGETKEGINVVKAQVNQAKAAVDAARSMLSNGTITAPADGVITQKNIDLGEFASPAVPIFTIDTNDNFINATLPTRLLNKIKDGQKVIISISELGKKYDGEISLISPTVDPRTKNVQVRVNITNPDSLIKPGMIAEIGYVKQGDK